MDEFVGGEPISVGIDEPITFENKSYTAFNVCYGIVFRKSGLYRVSITGRHVSIAVEPERKTGRWIEDDDEMLARCSECGEASDHISDFCPNCGADMRGEQNESD